MVLMKSLVLEKKGQLSIRDAEVNDTLGPNDCRVKVHSVGICGSDVHYYEHGSIGPFVVKKPMILGHEASGTVIAVGKEVKNLKAGDRVAMEPGIPRWDSAETLEGHYNLDPELTFFATPPIDGCLSTTVIHPAALCFKLPQNVSFAEGAMCEPIAVGMHAATKASIKPGVIGFVSGAGTIGAVTALCALSGGCSEVIVSDILEERLKFIQRYPGIHTANSKKPEEVKKLVDKLTDGRGCDVLFECSGAIPAYRQMYELAAPAATAVFVGMPAKIVPLDVVAIQAKELRIESVFRYRNVYPRIIRLLSSGKLNVKPLITKTFPFSQSVDAFKRATNRIPTDVKIMIEMDDKNPSKL